MRFREESIARRILYRSSIHPAVNGKQRRIDPMVPIVVKLLLQPLNENAMT